MRQFLVWTEEGVAEKQDTVVEDLFEAFEQDSDDETTVTKKKAKKDKKRKAESSNESSCTSESNDSDDKKAWSDHFGDYSSKIWTSTVVRSDCNFKKNGVFGK